MKTTFLRRGALAFLLFSVFQYFSVSAFAQGSLTPPGAPAPTMKALSQIEPRTPISTLPATLASGSYYLTQNLTTSSGTAITISGSGVEVDLEGFTISSTSSTASGVGIQINSGLHDITIRNGHIVGGVTYNGSSFTTGPGFTSGIFYSGTAPTNVRVSGVTVSGCSANGVYLSLGDGSSAVESCAVRTVGSVGIVAASVSNSTAGQCGLAAITGHAVENCRGDCVAGGDGIDANVATNCYGTSVSSNGIEALTAVGCFGTSTTGNGLLVNSTTGCYGSSVSGTGINAQIAENCQGISSTTGIGISAVTAENCYGTSGSGTRVMVADVALNCEAVTSGTGTNTLVMSVKNAENCYANGATLGGGSYGISAAGSVKNCYGIASNGISAETAEGSTGLSTAGFGIQALTVANSYGAPATSSTHIIAGIEGSGSAIGCFGSGGPVGVGVTGDVLSYCTGNGGVTGNILFACDGVNFSAGGTYFYFCGHTGPTTFPDSSTF